MKGIVFNLLESFICEGWGDDAYEEILERCPLKTEGAFVGPGTYPDSDLMTIASKTAEKLGLALPNALRAFGKYCFPQLSGRFPSFLDGHDDALSFLESVDGVIHVEVRKLFPKAVTPEFRCVREGPNRMSMEYRSQRQLCALAEGLLDGVSERFGGTLSFEHARCTHRGDECCEFRLEVAREVRESA